LTEKKSRKRIRECPGEAYNCKLFLKAYQKIKAKAQIFAE
jgi:hypothetical protein